MSAVMPGRAVDIVHAALAATGHRPYSLAVRWSYDAPIVATQVLGKLDEQAGRRIFAVLGAKDPTLGDRGRLDQAKLSGHVAALGARLDVLITDLPPLPDPAELHALADGADALVADVDAARAADEASAGGAA